MKKMCLRPAESVARFERAKGGFKLFRLGSQETGRDSKRK